MRLILAAVGVTMLLLWQVSAEEAPPPWDPEDLALALETIKYAINACDLNLRPEVMAASVASAGNMLGIGGSALADLMAEQEAKVMQLADLYLPAFCSQAESVATQFNML